MALPPSTSDVERRKHVRIRIRQDLAIAPQKYEGRTYYVVKDPVSLRYYRFKEQERFLIGLMDGEHTLDDSQKEYEKRFRPERLTLEDLESKNGTYLRGERITSASLSDGDEIRLGAATLIFRIKPPLGPTDTVITDPRSQSGSP